MKDKNICGYCGRPSGTNAPFPKKKISDAWLTVICPKCSSLEEIKLLKHKRTTSKEFKEQIIAQKTSDRKRKMVGNEMIDIIFWFDDDDSIYGFQYTIGQSTTFTWSKEKGSHYRIVFTERRKFETNTLQDTERGLPKEKFINYFLEGADNLKEEYQDLVLGKLNEYEK